MLPFATFSIVRSVANIWNTNLLPHPVGKTVKKKMFLRSKRTTHRTKLTLGFLRAIFVFGNRQWFWSSKGPVISHQSQCYACGRTRCIRETMLSVQALIFLSRGPFLERTGNLTGPKSYFETKVSRKVGCVLTSNEVHFLSLANYFTV